MFPRRVNLSSIFTLVLVAILTVTVNQYIKLSHKKYVLTLGSNQTIRSDVKTEGEEDNLLHISNLKSSSNIENILKKTRSRIRQDLTNYNFSYSGVNKLEDLLMESGGQPMRTVIVTTWRSGSTFTGELLNSMPSTYYLDEPLINYSDRQIRKPPMTDKAKNILRRVLNCDYSEMGNYFKHGKTHFYQFEHNKRIVKYCYQNQELCLNADFTGMFCKLFPFQVTKVVHLRLHLVEFLLDDKRGTALPPDIKMLRRVNFYSNAFAFILGVILSVTVIQFLNLNKQCDSYQNIKSEVKNAEDTLIHPIPNPNGSPNIENILKTTRLTIKQELRNYNFSYSGIRKLEDLLMESGGQPVRSVIVTTWRSGSSFTGELLNSMPCNYFFAEPLMQFANRQIRRPPLIDKAKLILKQMLNCNYSGMEDYFEHGKTHFYQFERNDELFRYCEKNEELCFNADFVSKFCQLFPFQNMKVVRMRLRIVKFLLEDKKLNVKIVLLIRDPRGVMQSRRHVEFCQASDCTRPERLCGDMISDHVTARKLLQKYPDKVTVLRFEDLVLNLSATTHRLFKFLRLQVMKQTEEFLQTHTNVKTRDQFSTFRVSQDVPFKWKYKLNFGYIEEIQEACREAMELWGYQRAHNQSHLASDDFNPLLPYTV